MRDSHRGKEIPKSTPSKQRKPNQTNNSLQKAVEPEAHASLFNSAPVIPCKECEQAINKGLSVKRSLKLFYKWSLNNLEAQKFKKKHTH